MVSSSREVVFLLKTAMDPSMATGFADIATRARQAQSDIGRIQKQAVDEHAKGEQQKVREAEKTANELTRVAKQQATEEAREQKESLQIIQATARERQRLAEETAAAETRTARKARTAMIAGIKEQQATTRQQSQLEKEAQQASEGFNSKLVGLAASRQGIIMGGMHVARGVALLLSSNEKDAAKLMKSLIMVQGAYDVLRGVTHIIHGIEGAYAAYTAAVAASAVAQTASAAAASASAKAHLEDAAAAEADAVANGNLAASAAASGAAQGASKIGGLSGLMGQGLTLGARGLGAIGGGSAAAGLGTIAVVAAPALVAYGMHRWRMNQGGEEDQRYEAFNKATEAQGPNEEYRNHQEQIEQVNREIRQGRDSLSDRSFQRGMTREEKMRDIRGPNLAKEMSDWSASREDMATGRREPGAAGYDLHEGHMAQDRSASFWITKKYEDQAKKAEEDVAAKRKAQAYADEMVEKSKRVEARERTGAEFTNSQAEAERHHYVRRAGSWFGSFFSKEGKSKMSQLEEQAQREQKTAQETGKNTSVFEGRAQGAAQATEDALKRQQEIVEKTAAEKDVAAQRDIKNSEEYISKLKEMHEAHLRNAEALEKEADMAQKRGEEAAAAIEKEGEAAAKSIEKSGRSFTIQMALEKPHERRKLMKAMHAAQGGHASNKQLALLAQNAEGSQKEAFEKQIENRRPEDDQMREFLGKGKSQADAERTKAHGKAETALGEHLAAGDQARKQAGGERDKAKDEEKRIKEQEQYVDKVKASAVQVADTMASRISTILTQILAAQEKRFLQAIERLEHQFESRANSDKATTTP